MAEVNIVKNDVENTQGEAEENYEDNFFPSLFINESYEDETYTIRGIVKTIRCSKAASTDHDLTGQIVWPVSVYLSWFIASNPELFRQKTVVEVGAGTGLSGIFASAFAKRVVLTDGNDIVLKMLQETISMHQDESCPVAAMPLSWGMKESFQEFVQEVPQADVIVGADVVCWPNLVKPLLSTVKALLQRSEALRPTFYCGFVCRAKSTEKLLYQTAKALGFVITRVASSEFLPDPIPSNVVSRIELQMLQIELVRGTPEAEAEVDFGLDEQLQTAC